MGLPVSHQNLVQKGSTMTNRSSYGSSLAAALIVGIGLSIYVFTSPTIATPNLGPVVQEQATSGFAYATLTKVDDSFVFDTGGLNPPREFSMGALMRTLNSQQRATMVNLLNAIGSRGWELVQKDKTGTTEVWLFKRSL